MDLLTWRDVQVQRPEIMCWRTATGEEVDFVGVQASCLWVVDRFFATAHALSDKSGAPIAKKERRTSAP